MFKKSDNQTDEAWLSLSDMMTVLMVIFLTVAIFVSFSSPQSSRAAQLVKNEEILCEKFKRKITFDLRQEIEIKCNPFRVIFLRPDTQFAIGRSEIRPAFQTILNKFIPIYISHLATWENREFISEIRVEGHASPIGPYIGNLRLSQDRSFNVSRYIVEQIVPENYGKQRMPPVESIIRTEGDKTIEKWTREKMTASGFSFMRPKCKDLRCKEVDNPASQRVEIRLHVNYASVVSVLDNRVLQGN